MKIFKKYDSEKGRTTPILDVDGHSFGFLAAHDAAAIKSASTPRCPAIVVNSATFSGTGTLTRTFQMVRYGRELLRVSWDGEKHCDPTIAITTHAAQNDILAQYEKDARWTRIS
jgi:hypothetical protein